MDRLPWLVLAIFIVNLISSAYGVTPPTSRTSSLDPSRPTSFKEEESSTSSKVSSTAASSSKSKVKWADQVPGSTTPLVTESPPGTRPTSPQGSGNLQVDCDTKYGWVNFAPSPNTEGKLIPVTKADEATNKCLISSDFLLVLSSKNLNVEEFKTTFAKGPEAVKAWFKQKKLDVQYPTSTETTSPLKADPTIWTEEACTTECHKKYGFVVFLRWESLPEETLPAADGKVTADNKCDCVASADCMARLNACGRDGSEFATAFYKSVSAMKAWLKKNKLDHIYPTATGKKGIMGWLKKKPAKAGPSKPSKP